MGIPSEMGYLERRLLTICGMPNCCISFRSNDKNHSFKEREETTAINTNIVENEIISVGFYSSGNI